MKTEDENAPTCTPYLPDDFVFDSSAEQCQAVDMKNEESVKLAAALQLALSKMENDWRVLDNEFGPTRDLEFGDLEGAIKLGLAEEIRIARQALIDFHLN